MECNTRLTKCIGQLMAVFYEYAAKDCEQGQEKSCGKDACVDQLKLSKRQFKELVEKELDMDEAKNPAKIEEMMKELDDDGDGQLDFYEFVKLGTGMACGVTRNVQARPKTASKARLTNGIGELMAVFQEYASKDCEQGQEKSCGKDACVDQLKLSKREFKELVQKELDMDDMKDPAKIEEMMEELDKNGDGQLDFHEFVELVTAMACLCNMVIELFMSIDIEAEDEFECDDEPPEP